MEDRLATFAEFEPTHFIAGTSGFVRYFGAKYADDFVVFESLRYGNALYVLLGEEQQNEGVELEPESVETGASA